MKRLMQNEPEARIYKVCLCTNDSCGLRFPALENDPRAETCPVCGSPTEIVSRQSFSGEHVGAWTAPAQSPIHLLLDNIRSAFNVGSIFRIADGAGVQHIYLCGITPTPENEKVAKTALGAESSVAWSYHRNALDLVKKLILSGKKLVALENTADSESLFGSQFLDNSNIVLVAGNEITGIDPALLGISDWIAHLPMAGIKGSLNVAVAVGISVYYLRSLGAQT